MAVTVKIPTSADDAGGKSEIFVTRQSETARLHAKHYENLPMQYTDFFKFQ